MPATAFIPAGLGNLAGLYPALLVQTPFDHKKAQGRNTRPLPLTTVRITGRVQEYDGETDDDGAMRAEVALEELASRERAVINSYELTRNIQKYAEVRSTINVDADGEAHMGQLLSKSILSIIRDRKIFILSIGSAGGDRYHHRHAGRHAAAG
jgi:hypothetical protein